MTVLYYYYYTEFRTWKKATAGTPKQRMSIVYYFPYQVVQSSSLHTPMRAQTTTLPHAHLSVWKSVSLRTQIRVQTPTLLLLI